MRRSDTIERIWRSGQYFGVNRPDSRIIVDREWTLATARTPGTAMSPRRQPGRWFQDPDVPQPGVELPAVLVRMVRIDRQAAAPAAQFTITCWNADPNNGPNKPAQGIYSQRRSFHDPDAPDGLRLIEQGKARWPQLPPTEDSAISGGGEAHSYGLIAQGNMIRIFQGYGSFYQDGRMLAHKSIIDGLDDGNLVRTLCGIIDTVDFDDQGNIEIAGRCTGALTDQIIYPPLVPIGCYPPQFFSKTYNLSIGAGPRGKVPSSTNYRDLADPIRLLAIWAGFYLPGARNTNGGRWPAIFGAIEDTGIDSTGVLRADVFDKKTVAEAIKTITDIVSYLLWFDQEGGIRWNSPNIWEAGNFDYDGRHHRFAFDIDEEVNLVSLKAQGTKQIDRSSITVAMADPYRNGLGNVKLAAFNTNTGSVKNQLHGMNLPAMIGLDVDISLAEMVTIAELVGVRIWFLRRRGQISAPALPLIDVDDQVRAWERVTMEHYLQRVESITTTHNVEDGTYMMDLGTHWMGADNENWAIRVGPNGHVIYNDNAAAGSTGHPARPGHTISPWHVPTYGQIKAGV